MSTPIESLIRQLLVEELRFYTNKSTNDFQTYLESIRKQATGLLESEYKNQIKSHTYGICGFPCSGDCMSCDFFTKLNAKKKIEEMLTDILTP